MFGARNKFSETRACPFSKISSLVSRVNWRQVQIPISPFKKKSHKLRYDLQNLRDFLLRKMQIFLFQVPKNFFQVLLKFQEEVIF